MPLQCFPYKETIAGIEMLVNSFKPPHPKQGKISCHWASQFLVRSSPFWHQSHSAAQCLANCVKDSPLQTLPQLILNSLLSFDNSTTPAELFLFGSVCECGLRNTVVRLCNFVKCGVLTLVREIPHNRNYCCCQWGYVMYVWFWNSLPLTHNYFIIISMVSALTWPDPVSAVLTGKHESRNINKLWGVFSHAD